MSLVVISDLDLVRVPVAPDKTNTSSVVDPNAVLSFAVTLQCFQTVTRRSCQVPQLRRRIKLSKLAKRHTLNIFEAFDRLAFMKLLCVLRPKGLDHAIQRILNFIKCKQV